MESMKDDGQKLRQLQNDLGVPPEAVCQEADVCMSTLYKVYGNKPVSANSANRVRKALTRLKERSRARAAG